MHDALPISAGTFAQSRAGTSFPMTDSSASSDPAANSGATRGCEPFFRFPASAVRRRCLAAVGNCPPLAYHAPKNFEGNGLPPCSTHGGGWIKRKFVKSRSKIVWHRSEERRVGKEGRSRWSP